MAKTKISEFSSTPANNTDIDSINIAEGCAPSGINDAIRELMAQLKDFQTGAVGDSFNGPIGTSTAAAGAFTTLSATGAITSTLATGTAPLVIASTTKVANLNVDLLDGADWAAPAALGSTTPAAGSFTTLGASSTATLNTLVSSGATLTGGTINGMTIGATTASTGAFTTLSASSTVTLSGGTANGVAYLNGSKVVTSGSALTFNGTAFINKPTSDSNPVVARFGVINSAATDDAYLDISADAANNLVTLDSTGNNAGLLAFKLGGSEGMRLTSTGLGIGTSSPQAKLVVSNAGAAGYEINPTGGIGGGATVSTYNRSTSAYTSLTTYSSAMTWYNGSTRAMDLDASGNLGIGTSSPAEKLVIAGGCIQVSGNLSSLNRPSSAIMDFFSGQTRFFSIGADSATFGGFSFRTSTTTTNTERMVIDSSGNLGLGVTPSASNLPSIQSSFGIFTGNNQANIAANAYYSSQWNYISTAVATLYTQTAGQHRWFNAPSGTAGNAITFTQAMTLTAGGGLLVGSTSTPASGSSTVLAANSGGGGVQLAHTGSGGGGLYVGLGGGGIATYTYTGAVGSESYTERARIDSSGNLLIGTTSNTNSSRCFVKSGGVGMGIQIGNTVSNQNAIDFYDGSGDVCGSITINPSANLTTYNTTSDYRLKNITGPITTSGAYIDSLNPVEGTWKSDGSTFVGLIAHEVQEASRTTVATGVKDGEEMQGMDYSSSEIIANLIAEVKSLRKRLADAGI